MNCNTTHYRANSSSVPGDPTNGLLWVVIIGGFAVVLFLYLRNSAGLFRSTKKIREEGDATEDEHTDIFTIDYKREVAKAEGSGNYRLATRLHFLQLLKVMADHQVVSYRPDSTNLDYLMQLAGGQHYDGFFRLARAYEYAWYGEFPVDREKYEVISRDFATHLNRFGRI